MWLGAGLGAGVGVGAEAEGAVGDVEGEGAPRAGAKLRLLNPRSPWYVHVGHGFIAVCSSLVFDV